jgi:hypothetical protein
MKIVAHDEDSMTNLFFSELHRHQKIADFLGLIEWRSIPVLPFGISAVELHQQVNFSEFGRPDAIILVTDSKGRKHVVIVEVKLGKYLDCCISVGNGKFNNKFNSKLNNQLTLKYRAMVSLSSIADKGYITESHHIAESPYSEDQIRRCKKASTIDFFKGMAGNGAQFYLVTLTSDTSSPTNVDKLAASDPCFPLFFNQNLRTQEEYCNLGSVLWSQCQQLFDGIESHISESFTLHFDNVIGSEESTDGPDQSELFVKGCQIIEYDGKLCHLSCKGYSFAIRHFRNGVFVEICRGIKDRAKYLELKNQIHIVRKAPKKPIVDVSFWEPYFQPLAESRQQ